MLASSFGTPLISQLLRKKRFAFDVKSFIDDWLRVDRTRSWVDMHSITPFLLTRQRLTFTYSCYERSSLVEIRTMFVDHTLRGRLHLGPDTRRGLLEAEAWVDTHTTGSRHVWCLGCKERVDFLREDFDVGAWQEHRDFCWEIRNMTKKAVVKEIIMQTRQTELLWAPNSRSPLYDDVDG
ncbi:uncharacterized protein BT62DRAFT_1006518 [Guyanagaster necrorhizus]|uniref:Uncharacterized protein n=1 Tax=Guyanagaster necrorhizus TaxID=856835 RepID=A0A9P7VRF0_9AGAR|nr:uncharacterized protein BT62DRAFT_1006518 [Guyanagaster necrorhizus MCA 3950]KAG7445539.1 hypothetical protein BT62DRAFT_1006518 [Guyanagaster necrorhizus MCA 3950]